MTTNPSSRHMNLNSWRKSTYSAGGGACVEIGHFTPEIRSSDHSPASRRAAFACGVRDSRTPRQGALYFASGEWSAFLVSVKSGLL
ncbi:DUF397 domain-containing protein [Marinactinospora rubrisoli]|uniref:DUF397 domain-containing protein n=1 Tax=Marinactinospora rubrisoli TaxID=2715399 RepID=A0ABW2KEU3_9ACTN